MLADKARLLSVSARHAASWLSVIPSVGLGLHLDPDECRTAVKWWLGLETPYGSNCTLCPDSALDPLGHHAATCKRGGDAVLRHNKLRDILVESFHRAHIHVQVEAGSGLSHDHSHSRPADILVFDWDHGKPAALNLTVVSPFNANILNEAGMTAGAAAQAAEARKHTAMTRSAPNWDGLVYLLLWSHMVPGARKPRSVSHFLPQDWLSTRQAASPRRHLTYTAD